MVFSNILFLFLFLPITLAMYHLAKPVFRNYILLIASILFYSIGEPGFVFLMLASILCNYLLAYGIDKLKMGASRTLLLILAVVLNLALLFIFKYLDLGITLFNFIFRTDFPDCHLALPIGISFFTFQALSYVIDVYRREVPAQKNPFYVALYISFFPQLIAGPIVRYQSIAAQIENRTVTIYSFGEGAKRFIRGLGKKVILANNLALLAEPSFADVLPTDGTLLWISSIAYTLQIFFDFSGYSDMAIGLGKMFGFDFPENFNYPYIASSVTDFWRRWHITLSSWFRDYVYIPLGGSRVRLPRCILNLFIVWALTGLWHGAKFSFVLWGLFYFVLLVFEKYVLRIQRIKNRIVRFLWRIITLVCVNFAWVVFNAPSLSYALQYIKRMVGFSEVTFQLTDAHLQLFQQYGVFALLGLLFCTPIAGMLRTKLMKHGKCAAILTYILPIGYLFLFLWSASYIVLGSHNPFIYFNF